MQKLVVPLVIVIIVVGIYIVLSGRPKRPSFSQAPKGSQESSEKISEAFSNPKKSAHYESNTPAHGAILAAVPVNVVIDFNFDLAKPSSISIRQEGKEYGVGETVIDQNKLAMRREMNEKAPEGVYTVEYNACWPDGSCHDGNFQFKIQNDLKESLEDERGQKEVLVDLAQIAFLPKDIRIDRGTKVTWVNKDEVEHYVNTDSHPAHTYYKEQNSQTLKKGDSYSLIFAQQGLYPYHCSAHAATMTGTIIVE